MNNKPIIILFEENELNISALYSLYAQNIPEKSAFWNRLSQEEIAHAAHIGNNKDVGDIVVENKFTRGIINYVMDFVLEEIEKAGKGEVTHGQALQTALRIERSMLEKKCFDMFAPTNQTVKEVFRKLNSGTERHVEALLGEMKKNGLRFEKDDAK